MLNAAISNEVIRHKNYGLIKSSAFEASNVTTSFTMDCHLIRAPSTAQLILKLLRWTSRAQLCSTRGKTKEIQQCAPPPPPPRHRAVFCSSQNHGTQNNVNWRSIRLSWKRVLHGGQCSRRRLPAHISFSFSLSVSHSIFLPLCPFFAAVCLIECSFSHWRLFAI